MLPSRGRLRQLGIPGKVVPLANVASDRLAARDFGMVLDSEQPPPVRPGHKGATSAAGTTDACAAAAGATARPTVRTETSEAMHIQGEATR